jgi:WD40 repeat protein
VSEREEKNPYVGPGPFDRKDAGRFFGREQEAADLYSLVAAHRTVLLYAQSGAGKTSLINARLIPRLEEGGYEVFVAARISQPSGDSAKQNQIQNIFMANAVRTWALAKSANEKASPPGASLEQILNSRSKKVDAHGYPCPRVLVFDQSEELFTAYPDRWQDIQGFFKCFDQAMNADESLRVLFAMREDFVAQLDPYVDLLPEELRTRYRLERLRSLAALDAVKKPLEETNIHFRPGVAEELVRDLLKTPSNSGAAQRQSIPSLPSAEPSGDEYIVEEFVEPVQLQVVCFNLFRNLPAGTVEITEEHMAAYGDVDQALREFYRTALKETAEKSGVREDSLREWFETKLITEAASRGIVFRGETATAGMPNDAVIILDEQFHIIRPEVRGKDRWYELSHDRFIRPILRANDDWRARAATEKEKRQTEERDRLAGQARKFQFLSIAFGVLALVVAAAAFYAFRERLRAEKASLDQAHAEQVAVARARDAEINSKRATDAEKSAELAKMDAERASLAYQQEARLAKKSASQAEAATKAETIALEAEQGALNDANSERDRANAKTLEADAATADETGLKEAAQVEAHIYSARALAATALNRRGEDPQVALWLALYSIIETISGQQDASSSHSVTVTRQSLEALQGAMPGALLERRQKTPCGGVMAVAFEGTGERLWAVDNTGAATSWDLKSTRATVTAACGIGVADAVSLSPDGTLMAVSGPNRQPSTDPLSQVTGLRGKVFVSDLQAASPDPRQFPAHGYQPEAIAFSDDNRFLGVAGPWTRRAVFDLSDNHQLWGSWDARIRRVSYRVVTLLFGRPPRVVNQVAFSPNDKILAVGVADGIIEFWNINTGRPTGLFLHAHNEPIRGLSFSPNSRLLVTTSLDKTAKIWTIESLKQASLLWPLTGHQDAVLCATFDRLGERVATGSQDQTIAIWDVKTGQRLIVLPAEGGYVTSLAYSKDGKSLASGSSDGSVRIWNMSALDDDLIFGEKFQAVQSKLHFDGDVGSISTSDATDLLNMAKKRVTRNLSRQECAEYFHGAGCPSVP